ncbi:MAG: ribonuclease P protein component 3 [Candidatus Methanoperedenaceae archaeon]|nr:MAG: ribonuclease P protein component 3 [Candidatus Methanoperedenaceae archaeon]
MSQFDHKFYDFLTHPDSPGQMAAEAKRYGYSGIVVTSSKTNEEILLPEDFSIYKGIEIQAKPSRIREQIKKLKNSGIISIVRGGEEEINRAAVESVGLDILLQPLEFNNVLAKAASDHSIAIGFNLGSLIKLKGDARIRELNYMKTNIKHARKYNLEMILTGDSGSVYDLRSPREMAALSSLFGMTQSEAVDAMSAIPLGILRRKSPNYVQEGIEIL